MSAANEDVDCELENDMEEVMNITPRSPLPNVDSKGNALNLVGTSMYIMGGHESARYVVHVFTCFAIHFTF
jgi:hypothetical protein